MYSNFQLVSKMNIQMYKILETYLLPQNSEVLEFAMLVSIKIWAIFLLSIKKEN